MLYIMLSFADNEKHMDASEASKRLREMARDQGNFLYTRHAMVQMAARNIANGDVRNVLMRGRIYGPPELVNETWRYKVETKKIHGDCRFEISQDRGHRHHVEELT